MSQCQLEGAWRERHHHLLLDLRRSSKLVTAAAAVYQNIFAIKKRVWPEWPLPITTAINNIVIVVCNLKISN